MPTQHFSTIPRLLLAVAGTLALIFLADQLEEIGERVPLVFVSLWIGTAALVSIMFISCARQSVALAPASWWCSTLRRSALILLPLALTPCLEMKRSGYDHALWLIDGALVISLCSVPYFTMLAKSIVGATSAFSKIPKWSVWKPANRCPWIRWRNRTSAIRKCGVRNS